MKVIYDLSVSSARFGGGDGVTPPPLPPSPPPPPPPPPPPAETLLSLDFASGVYTLAGTATTAPGILSFGRMSAAAYVDASGALAQAAVDQMRYDHDPATLAARGVLIEASATNVLTYSSDFTNAGWTKSGATIDAAVAVVGGIPLHRLNVTPTTARHEVYHAVSGYSTAGVTMTVSAFLKTGGAGFACVSLYACGAAVVDLATGAITDTTGANYIASGSEDMGNGLWRVWVRATTRSGTNYAIAGASGSGTPSYASGQPSYAGVEGEDVLVAGVQAEPSAAMSSYIATTSAAVTRAADVIAVTGAIGAADVRITYDDASTEVLLSEVIGAGWWPTLARPRVKSIVAYPEGTL